MDIIMNSCGVAEWRYAVEILSYPFEEVHDIVAEYGLSICLDIGHVMRIGGDPTDLFDTYRERISVIHLHGYVGEKDHLPLDVLRDEELSVVFDICGRFSGAVCLEVFSLKYLQRSLQCMERIVRE